MVSTRQDIFSIIKCGPGGKREMMRGHELQSHWGQQSLAEKSHRKRHECLDEAVSTCSEPGTDKAGSACVTSVSVLCCQLWVRRGWELPSHKETY